MQRHIATCLYLVATVTAAQAQVGTALPPPLATAAEMAAEGTSPAAGGELVRVPVLKQTLQRGDTIVAENIASIDIPAKQVFASTITNEVALVGQKAVRPLEAGKPINKLHVRVAPLVSRDQTVTLVYRRGGVQLTGAAKALEDGQAGDTIRIVNPATRSTLSGVVGRDGSVEVN